MVEKIKDFFTIRTIVEIVILSFLGIAGLDVNGRVNEAQAAEPQWAAAADMRATLAVLQYRVEKLELDSHTVEEHERHLIELPEPVVLEPTELRNKYNQQVQMRK